MKAIIENFDGESDYRERREILESDGYELITTYGFGDRDIYRLNLHTIKLENEGKTRILQCQRGFQIFLKRTEPGRDTETLQAAVRAQITNTDRDA